MNRGKFLRVYTDGACSGVNGPAGCGVVYEYENGYLCKSFPIGNATNQIAELRAIGLIQWALLELAAAPIFGWEVEIVTDSLYAIGVLSGKWRAKANVQLIADIQAIFDRAEIARIEWTHVRGHSGNTGNELADRMAVRGREGKDFTVWIDKVDGELIDLGKVGTSG